MMSKTFWFSVLAFFVGTMSTAYPWHVVWFHERYVALGALTRVEPIMPLGMTAVLIQGIVFAYFYPMYFAHRKGGNHLARGAEFSLMLGLTIYSTMTFATAAKFKIEPVSEFVLLSTGFGVLQFLVVGLLIGFVHRMFSAK